MHQRPLPHCSNLGTPTRPSVASIDSSLCNADRVAYARQKALANSRVKSSFARVHEFLKSVEYPKYVRDIDLSPDCAVIISILLALNHAVREYNEIRIPHYLPPV